jgi:bifunctional non-homologous end joining protein LigD
VLDLDPGPPAGMLQACRVALLLRAEPDALGLASYAKTSGGKGLHVYVPVPGMTYDETKDPARALARRLVAARPDLVVDRLTTSSRVGKVLVDWSQNDPGTSTVAPWSARAQVVPTVSMPVAWDEVEVAVGRGDDASLAFALAGVPRRAAQGDLFAPVLAGGQGL